MSTDSPVIVDHSAGRRFDGRRFFERYGSLVALALLIAFGCLASPEFRQVQNFLNVLRQSSFVGIIAVGMTFVIVLGGIDLSVGSMVALLGGAGIMALNAFAQSGWDPIYAIAASMSVMVVGGAILGLFNGLIIAKGGVTPFIATLGTMAAYRSLSVAFAQGGQYTSNVRGFGHLGSEGIHVPFIEVSPGQPLTLDYPVLILAIVAVLAHFLLKRSPYGMYVHSIGDNEQAATYSAVRIDTIRILTYMFIGIAAGVTAMLVASRQESVSSSQTGTLYELDAIAAVVVGGTSMRGGSGRVWSTVVGVLILGFVGNMMSMVITPWLQEHLKVENLDANHLEGLIKGAIIIAAVLVQRDRRRS